MGAVDLVKNLMAEGVEFTTDGERIRWRNARGRITPQVIAELKAGKSQVLGFLSRMKTNENIRGGIPGPVIERDWRVEFEERAAILEYDQGLSRADAEALAHVLIYGVKCGRVASGTA